MPNLISELHNIFLVGPMGAGKTTIGRQLARELNKTFHDSDRELEARTGVDIPLIFDIEGEAGFRRREKAMIAELVERQDIVLATGGGAVLDADTRALLGSRGFVIYLFAPLERLYERTRRDRNRPLLQTPDPRKAIADLMARRDPLYRSVADLIVETDSRTVRAIVRQIRNKLKEL